VIIVLYRVLETDYPALRDFRSQRERGQPLRHQTRKALHLWDGLSVYKTDEQARQLAQASPRVGNAIARLHLPFDAAVTVELDTARNGHCTLWGNATDLLRFIVDVSAV
jgi:hypothetical protein